MSYVFASLLIILFSCLSPRGVEAVDLQFSASKNYGTLNQKAGVEINGSIDQSTAQAVANSFSSTNIYFKLSNPPASFPSSSAFSILNNVAGGWYLTLNGDSSSLSFLSSFSSKTTKPIVVEVSPFNSSFIQEVKNRYPQIKIHTAGYMFWPREDVKNAVSQVKPPTLEAISIKVESDVNDDLFPNIKLMFDTFFDASGDIAGTSGVKINWPSDSSLALSGIQAKTSDDYKKIAYRRGVSAASSVTSVQFQGKSGKAPMKYVVMGPYNNLSSSGKTIAARYARFLSAGPAVIWPMAINGNGDPYDNGFFKESNSKPVVGIIGTIQGKTEGVIVNASSGNTSVTLPYAISANAYSSRIGSFILTTSLELSPHETVIFGEYISRSSPPPQPQPTTPDPTNPPPQTVPSSTPRLPLPTTAVPPPIFPTATSVPFQITPPFSSPSSTTQQPPLTIHWKPYAKLAVVKADPFLKIPLLIFQTITKADKKLENTIHSLFQTALNHVGISL